MIICQSVRNNAWHQPNVILNHSTLKALKARSCPLPVKLWLWHLFWRIWNSYMHWVPGSLPMTSGVMYPRESVCAEHANIMQHPISEISASMENRGSSGIPKSDGGLNAQLIFECSQSHLARKWSFNCLAALGGIVAFSASVLKKMATVTRSGSWRYHHADHGEHDDIDIMVTPMNCSWVWWWSRCITIVNLDDDGDSKRDDDGSITSTMENDMFKWSWVRVTMMTMMLLRWQR